MPSARAFHGVIPGAAIRAALEASRVPRVAL